MRQLARIHTHVHIHTYRHTPAYRCHWPAVASHPISPLIPLLLGNYHLGYALHMRLYPCQPSHFGFHSNPAPSNGAVRLWRDKWLASVRVCLMWVSMWMTTVVIVLCECVFDVGKHVDEWMTGVIVWCVYVCLFLMIATGIQIQFSPPCENIAGMQWIHAALVMRNVIIMWDKESVCAFLMSMTSYVLEERKHRAHMMSVFAIPHVKHHERASVFFLFLISLLCQKKEIKTLTRFPCGRKLKHSLNKKIRKHTHRQADRKLFSSLHEMLDVLSYRGWGRTNPILERDRETKKMETSHALQWHM